MDCLWKQNVRYSHYCLLLAEVYVIYISQEHNTNAMQAQYYCDNYSFFSPVSVQSIIYVKMRIPVNSIYYNLTFLFFHQPLSWLWFLMCVILTLSLFKFNLSICFIAIAFRINDQLWLQASLLPCIALPSMIHVICTEKTRCHRLSMIQYKCYRLGYRIIY